MWILFFIEREGNKGGVGTDYKSPSEKVMIILQFVFIGNVLASVSSLLVMQTQTCSAI